MEEKLDDKVEEKAEENVELDEDSWTEKNVEVEVKEEEEEKFSIGDTMLARGGTKEGWKEEEGFRGESLEESVDWEEEGFGEGVEEEEEEGFSYETMGEHEDFYGAGVGGDLYGGSGRDLYGESSVSGAYGAGVGGDFYGGAGKGGSNLYGVDKTPGARGIAYVGMSEGKNKKIEGVSYAVGTGGKRKGKVSGLEGEVRVKKKRSRGVSLY